MLTNPPVLYVLNVKAVVAAFNQEKPLVQLHRLIVYTALASTLHSAALTETLLELELQNR